MIFIICILLQLRAVQIEIKSHDDVYELHKLGVSIEGLKENWVKTKLNETDIRRLERLGYKIKTLPPQKIYRKGYHGYDALTLKLDSIVIEYPDITKLMSIGKSVEGREIWALCVTDYPDLIEEEPEIRIASTIHGNEPPGTELILYMIDSLTQTYDIDPTITWLVDTREIWFIPMLNPDGNAYGTRANANGVDLNRNFPVPGTIPDTSQWEPETRAFIEWSREKNFNLSCMYHTGARVTNYQWDYCNELPPDDVLINEVALGYSRLNYEMYTNPAPSYADSGVIRGWLWYQAVGTLQDWSWDETSCLDLTIELDPTFWPDPSFLPELWNQNKESMLYLIWKAGTGVSGRVTECLTHNPIYATINAGEKEIKTDKVLGDYHRMLLDGVYEITAQAPGYRSETKLVEVCFDSITPLNFELRPILALSGTITDIEDNPLAAEVVAMGIDTVLVGSDSTGYYETELAMGIYDLQVISPGYDTLIKKDILIQADTTVNFKLIPQGVEEITKMQITKLEVYPNPFTAGISVQWSGISEGQRVSLQIYDLSGRLVKTLTLNTNHLPLTTAVYWDARDDNGVPVSSGIYFLKFLGNTRKLVCLK
ncbi:DUF2817 domain-containing protein [candidate division WOR-3 bacterium]|nr:DUF2817 domain-containing protein [candidate division WOR-3 bacterium]